MLITVISLSEGSELRIKRLLSVAVSSKYDDNMIYPDSISSQGSWISDALLRPSLLLQFSPKTLVRINTLAQTQYFSTSGDHLHTLDASASFNHFFSNLTMCGASLHGARDFSLNPFYASTEIAASLSAGQYFGPGTNLEINITGEQKQFPQLYKYPVGPDSGTRSFYYDYREATARLTLSQTAPKSITIKTAVAFGLKDYFNDTHKYEYTYLQTETTTDIDYIDLGTNDTVFRTVSRPHFVENIHQKDQSTTWEGAVTTNPANHFFVTTGCTFKYLKSNDAYFTSRYLSPLLRLSFDTERFLFKTTYSYFHETFPDRNEGEIKEQEESHYASCSILSRIAKPFNLEFEYIYRNFNSYIDAFDYTKKVLSLTGKYSL